MKFLVLLSCALAIASAGWAPAQYNYHVPVIGPLGVPVDTPEVQHARAAHLAALASASHGAPAYQGGDDGSYNDGRYNGHDDGSARYYGPHAYPTTHGAAHVTHDGVPVETPEVAAAKAHHFSAFSEALSRNVHVPHGHGLYRKRRGVYGYSGHVLASPEAHDYNFYGISHDGRPLDTPAVAHAKAAHYAAFNEAAARNGVGHHHGVVAPVHYAAPYAYGVLSHGGVPVDTPEVQHAKAAHFAAHAAARGHHY